jgi:glucosamine-6-phosphate deaminase
MPTPVIILGSTMPDPGVLAEPEALRSFMHQGLQFHVYDSAQAMGEASACALATEQIALAAERDRIGFLIMAAPSGYPFYAAYAALAAQLPALQQALAHTHFFQFDDYPLPPEHPATFRYLLQHKFFDRIRAWCPEANIHRLRGEAMDIDAELARYTREVLDHGPDIQLKGVGENGHWGFHEPGIPLDSEPVYIRVPLSEENARQQLRDHPDLFCHIEDVPREAFTANVALFLCTHGRIEDNIPQPSKAFAVLAAYGTDVIDPAVPTSALKRHPNAVVRLSRDSSWALEKLIETGAVDGGDISRLNHSLGGDSEPWIRATLDKMRVLVRT